jgi:hypothetical protein
MPLWPQTASPSIGQYDEPLSFIGMKLEDLLKRFGSPQTVSAVRGGEVWQDDVVFVYNEGEFYIYRDRVWQVGLRSFYNMRVGDAKAVALLVLGEHVQDKGDYLIYTFSGTPWPLSLCVNVSAGKIAAIFLYRSDY